MGLFPFLFFHDHSFFFLLSIYTCIIHRLEKRLATPRRDYSRLGSRLRVGAYNPPSGTMSNQIRKKYGMPYAIW
jgi:hypothetical protein